MKHQEVHPDLNVEGCFGCKVAGVSFGSNSTTTRGGRVNEINRTERQWNADMPAYKRLRRDGLQPRSVDGAAELERRATTEAQIEGRVDVERLQARGIAE